MPRKLTDQYFENQTEKVNIKSKIVKAIPEGVTYFNLILALTELTQEWAALAFDDTVMTYHRTVQKAKEEEKRKEVKHK